MEILLILLWYMAGILSLYAFAVLTKQKIAKVWDLILLAAVLGPVGVVIGLLLRKVPQRRPELRLHSKDRVDDLWT